MFTFTNSCKNHLITMCTYYWKSSMCLQLLSYNGLAQAGKRCKNSTKIILRGLYMSFHESATFKWQDVSWMIFELVNGMLQETKTDIVGSLRLLSATQQ